MPVKTSLKGDAEMRRRLISLANKFPNYAKRALYVEGEAVMRLAKRDYVPVAEHRGGTLMSSGYVDEPKRSGRDIIVEIGFGGGAGDYALALHEHPSPSSPPSWAEHPRLRIHRAEHGKPKAGVKYLERPLKVRIRGMRERLATNIRAEVEGRSL